jgi:hypothetical protein
LYNWISGHKLLFFNIVISLGGIIFILCSKLPISSVFIGMLIAVEILLIIRKYNWNLQKSIPLAALVPMLTIILFVIIIVLNKNNTSFVKILLFTL